MVICLWAVSLSCLNMANAAAEDVQPFLRVVGAVRAALRQHPRVAGASSGILHWCCWERLRLQSPTRSYLTCLQLIRCWFLSWVHPGKNSAQRMCPTHRELTVWKRELGHIPSWKQMGGSVPVLVPSFLPCPKSYPDFNCLRLPNSTVRMVCEISRFYRSQRLKY